MNGQKRHFLSAILSVFLALSVLAGCAFPSPKTPSSPLTGQTPEANYTAAVQTVVAQLTQAAGTSAPPTTAPTQAPPTAQATATTAPTQPPPPSATPTSPQPTATQPQPTATTAPSATALSSSDPKAGLGDPTFKDVFADATNWGFFKDKHSIFEVTDGALVLTALKADSFDSWALTWPKTTMNFYLEMTATSGSCSGLDRYGLMVRAPRFADQGYLFGVSCDGKYSFRLWDGKKYTRLVDWTASSKILAGKNQTNRLGIKVEDTKFTLYVNGALLTTVKDDTFDTGYFGVFVAASETANFAASVKEIDYWELP